MIGEWGRGMRGEKDTWARVGLEHCREEETFRNREEDETLFYISVYMLEREYEQDKWGLHVSNPG